jgi:fatty acid desaturase
MILMIDRIIHESMHLSTEQKSGLNDFTMHVSSPGNAKANLVLCQA